MSDRFELRAGEHVVRADLLVEQAPRICRAFAGALPLESFAVHAKFAGDELIVMLPFVAAAENEVGSVAPGDIGYYPSRQTLCLVYGDITPFASVHLFARVLPEDLPAARAIGREVLAAGAGWVQIAAGDLRRRASARRPAATPARRTAAGRAVPPAANGLVERLAAATRAGWANEPPDVRRLPAYRRPPIGPMPP